jgi:hypothetical protein
VLEREVGELKLLGDHGRRVLVSAERDDAGALDQVDGQLPDLEATAFLDPRVALVRRDNIDERLGD